MITLSIMMANIMQGVDNTILNVALPHIQGSLSASLDQIAWALNLLYRLRCDHDATHWLARRSVRHQICLPGLGHRLHARFRAVRRCYEPPGTRLLSRVAGGGWRWADPAVSGYPVSDKSAGAPRARNGGFRYRDNPRANYR